MVTRILLTGAGFSRNWGGWLGVEVFEYLIGHSAINEYARGLLWEYRREGFEAVLGKLDTFHEGHVTMQDQIALQGLNHALREMFREMNRGFRMPIEGHRWKLLQRLFRSFDAVFTLNQDLLVEQWHRVESVGTSSWKLYRPGLQPATDRPGWSEYCPTGLELEERRRPYIKLHGSSDFATKPRPSGYPLLVQGGNKPWAIERHPLLNWYHKVFREMLVHETQDVRLMIVGYGFGDAHINEAIRQSAEKGRLSMFVVDPNGVDTVEKAGLESLVVGASRRPIRETFQEPGTVEQSKFERFLDLRFSDHFLNT